MRKSGCRWRDAPIHCFSSLSLSLLLHTLRWVCVNVSVLVVRRSTFVFECNKMQLIKRELADEGAAGEGFWKNSTERSRKNSNVRVPCYQTKAYVWCTHIYIHEVQSIRFNRITSLFLARLLARPPAHQMRFYQMKSCGSYILRHHLTKVTLTQNSIIYW